MRAVALDDTHALHQECNMQSFHAVAQTDCRTSDAPRRPRPHLALQASLKAREHMFGTVRCSRLQPPGV